MYKFERIPNCKSVVEMLKDGILIGRLVQRDGLWQFEPSMGLLNLRDLEAAAAWLRNNT